MNTLLSMLLLTLSGYTQALWACHEVKLNITDQAQKKLQILNWPELKPIHFYQDLLRQQELMVSEEQLANWRKLMLDLPRPGLAKFKNKKKEPDFFQIIQGSGRFEKLKPDQWVDTFVMQNPKISLPSEVIVLEQNLDFELVLAINSLSTRGPAGANPIFLHLHGPRNGEKYQRVLVPYRLCEAFFSEISHEVETVLLPQLKEALGPVEFEKFVNSEDFKTSSLVEKKELLESKLKQLKGN